jgi:hypothetical protein
MPRGEVPSDRRGADHTGDADDTRLISGGIRGSGIDSAEPGEDLPIAAMRRDLRNVVDQQEA